MFRRMLLERPEHGSSPGETNTRTLPELHVAKPMRWTMGFVDRSGRWVARSAGTTKDWQ
ncbi:MAG: hypothetical protein ACXW61_00665 [Gemmatirosa sp.]